MSKPVMIEGREYTSPDSCSFGDYSGAGSVGLANIRTILAECPKGWVYECGYNDITRAVESEPSRYAMDSELELRAAIKSKRPPIVIHATGDYSSETVYLRNSNKWAAEIIENLERYPVIDDDSVSQIEMEWEDEAWDDWLRSDLERAAWNGEDESPDYDTMEDSLKFQAYRFAMEVENVYPTAEENGVHVRVEDIAATYRKTIESLTAGETIESLSRKQWPSAYGPKP